MKRKHATAICAWFQYDGVNEWAVSLEDEDGEEISCDSGDASFEVAWERACELADDLGIPAYAQRDGQEIRSYSPGPTDDNPTTV